jgi:predicted nucleic acid-binding protein
VGAFSRKDARHKESTILLHRVGQGEFGRAFVTDHVVTEVLNYFVAKSRDPGYPERVARAILGEGSRRWAQFVWVNPMTWAAARARFARHSRTGLSFTDCTSVAVVEGMGLEAILSFDRGFDGVVPRIS